MHHIEWKMGGWMIHLSEAKSKLLNDKISIFFKLDVVYVVVIQ